MVMKKGIDI